MAQTWAPLLPAVSAGRGKGETARGDSYASAGVCQQGDPWGRGQECWGWGAVGQGAGALILVGNNRAMGQENPAPDAIQGRAVTLGVQAPPGPQSICPALFPPV